MRKIINMIIIISFLGISLNIAKPSVNLVGDKTPIISAIGAFVGASAILTTIICLKNSKKEKADKDFVLEDIQNFSDIEKQELEKIYDEEEKPNNLAKKIIGLGLLPSAAIGGSLYWYLSGHTYSGYKKYIFKGIKGVESDLGDGFSDGKSNLFSEKVRLSGLSNESIDEFLDSNFGSLPECEEFLQGQRVSLQDYIKVLDGLKEDDQSSKLTEDQKGYFGKLRDQTSSLSKKIAHVIRCVKVKSYYRREKREYNRLKRIQMSQDNMKKQRNHDHVRDVMWIWALLNGVGKIVSIFGG